MLDVEPVTLQRPEEITDYKVGHALCLTLRRGDNLTELEQSFNDLARTLREREWEDVEALRKMAESAPTDPSGVAARIRELAKRKRARLE